MKSIKRATFGTESWVCFFGQNMFEACWKLASSTLGSIAAGQPCRTITKANRRADFVSASLLHLEWLGKKFNVLDCPGYTDFISEGLGALRVGDFALIVVNAAHGVGVGTDAVWKYATQFGIPKMIVVNAFDKEGADFGKVLAQVREHGPRVFR
jgi:elongation factor G